MALRNPIYLDLASLVAQAEYNDIHAPHQQDVVEKRIKRGGGSAKIGWGPLSGGGEVRGEVELQSSYTITPTEKTVTSRLIDQLIRNDHVKTPGAALARDDLVELDGNLRITTVSLAGKLLYLLRQLLGSAEIDARHLDFSAIEPDAVKRVQQVYLGNELVPIPVLLEVADLRSGTKLYVNLPPDHFVGAATVDHIEGERRVLGTVANLIGDDADGFLSSEKWLLWGWEYLTKRLLMTAIGEKVAELVDQIGITDLPTNDVRDFIRGPAVVVDAIAIY